MNFRTEFVPKKASWSIDLKDPVLTLGSCFADAVGSLFEKNKFPVLINPFGTTYHPLSIHTILRYAAHQESPPEHTYLARDGMIFNYGFHSEFSAGSKQELVKKITESVGTVHYYIKNCNVLILTYGTAWIYERSDTGEPVANCHKMPAELFSKRLASVDEILKSFKETIELLKTIQPSLHIILTVSPVRHIKDTLALNNLSKSVLRISCHQIAEVHPGVDYFPAFEIMMDDLRDYRYYKDDLLHPTEAAENYIWEKFCATYFKPSTQAFVREWEEIRKALSHNAFHVESESHQKFLKETMDRLEELKLTVNVEKEINMLRNQLKQNV